MKKYLLLAFTLFVISSEVFSQVPKSFNYQGIVLDSSGYVLSEKPITIKFSLMEDSIGKVLSYQEIIYTTSDKWGQFSVNVGSGKSTFGSLNNIPWESGNVYLKVEIDINGNNTYKQAQVTRLLSVPFSLYAADANVQSDDFGNTKGGTNALLKPEPKVTNGNTAFGASSLMLNIGESNSAFGLNSLMLNKSGNANTGIGWRALMSNSSGSENTAVGHHSMGANLTGNNNSALGRVSAHWNMTGSNNTSIGYAASFANRNGSFNTALGQGSLQNDSSSFNTAIGSGAMGYKISGSLNTSLGFQSGYALESGSKNIFIGNNAGNNPLFKTISNKLIIQNDTSSKALIYGEFDNKKVTINGDLNVTGKVSSAFDLASDLYGNTKAGTGALLNPKLQTAIENTAFGFNALNGNIYGSRNTAVGNYALSVNEGNDNTAFGWASLGANKSGVENTAVGHAALSVNTTGSLNSAFGRHASYWNKSGKRNTALGYGALFGNYNGISNTAVGIMALQNDTASFNTAVGDWALGLTFSGEGNTALGYLAGNSLKTGNNNIFIGKNSGNDVSFSSVSDKLIIANSGTSRPLIYGDFANQKIRFNANVDSLSILNRITFQDENANDHINKYDNGIPSPALYSRYFYGQYGDLIIQGMSKVYTGNIHFVTGSNEPNASKQAQRMVIMANGKVGIGDFVNGGPRAKLEVKEGDVYLSDPQRGIILTSPNGKCWRVTINDNGEFVRTAISCPVY